MEKKRKGGETARSRVDLREDLLELLRQPGVRQKISEALLREATGETKSSGVIRAFELVQKIVGEVRDEIPPEELDLSRLSDKELRAMLARCRQAGASLLRGRKTAKSADAARPEDGGAVLMNGGAGLRGKPSERLLLAEDRPPPGGRRVGGGHGAAADPGTERAVRALK